jgi:hypothetical protein
MNKTILQKSAWIAALTIALCSTNVYAQRGGIPARDIPPVDITTTLQTGILRLDNIAEVEDKELTAIGSVYLAEEWSKGTIYTSSGHTLPDVPLRYDLKNNLFEINLQDGVKVLSGRYVKLFQVAEKEDALRSEYVNGEKYKADENLAGFLKVLAKGEKAELLKRYELKQVHSNYSAILDVGNKTGEVVKSEKLYLAIGNQLAALKGRNDYSSFGKFEEEVKSYARKYKLKIHREEDAILLVTYFNTLL